MAQWRPLSAVCAVVAGLVLGLGAGWVLVAAWHDSIAVGALSGVVTDAVLLAVVVAVAARGATRLGAATLGIRRTAFWPALGWALAILVGVMAADALLATLFGPSSGGRHGHAHHLATAPALLAVLALTITAPIVEEVAFRGYLFPALSTWRGPLLAAVITAVLFGSAHVFALPPWALPGAAAFGLGACLLVWFTGSLLPGMGVHSLNNAVVLAVLTGGQLAWAIPLAPLAVLLVMGALGRERAPEQSLA